MFYPFTLGTSTVVIGLRDHRVRLPHLKDAEPILDILDRHPG